MILYLVVYSSVFPSYALGSFKDKNTIYVYPKLYMVYSLHIFISLCVNVINRHSSTDVTEGIWCEITVCGRLIVD